jgi:hypothetical protein
MMILGNYSEQEDKKDAIKLKLTQTDLVKVWKRCGITANYGANYISYSQPDEKEIENSASMILNELLENAAKYSSARESTIEILITILDETVVFQVDNYIEERQFELFKKYVSELVYCEDINGMYFRKLQAFSENNDMKSGIGLLTIMSCFNPKIGFKFQRFNETNNYRVSVQAAIPLKGQMVCS